MCPDEGQMIGEGVESARERTRQVAEQLSAQIERVAGPHELDPSSWLGQLLTNGVLDAETWGVEEQTAATGILAGARDRLRRARARSGALSSRMRAELGFGMSTMLDTHLPLNRKERYYTGTVLPMLIASEGFVHLSRFLVLCGLGHVELDLGGLDERPSLQFYTEYSFAESVVSTEDLGRFGDRPLERDTPDLVIVGPDWLLAVEAKMFHRPSAQALRTQVSRQRAVVDYVATQLGLATDRVVHVLLLPQDLAAVRSGLVAPVVTWEQVLQSYEPVAPGYWLDVLAVALERYCDLASAEPTFGTNADAMLTGEAICACAEPEYGWMGRRGGLDGPDLAKDLVSGTWRTRAYEVRHLPLDGNRNWFTTADFRAKVTAGGQGVASDPPPQAGEVSLHEADGRYLDAVVGPDSSVVFRGQDLSGQGEYEYALTVAAADVPKLTAALGGDEDDHVLDLLARHAEEIYAAGESRWLKSHGIPAQFWSRRE